MLNPTYLPKSSLRVLPGAFWRFAERSFSSNDVCLHWARLRLFDCSLSTWLSIVFWLLRDSLVPSVASNCGFESVFWFFEFSHGFSFWYPRSKVLGKVDQFWSLFMIFWYASRGALNITIVERNIIPQEIIFLNQMLNWGFFFRSPLMNPTARIMPPIARIIVHSVGLINVDA